MIVEMIPTEVTEARALMQWITLQKSIRDYFIHIPNEGKRDTKTGYNLKLCGLKPGVSDYFLALPKHGKHGLWIELKRRKNSRLTTDQAVWLDRMRSLNYEAVAAFGWEEARDAILQYMDNNNKTSDAA